MNSHNILREFLIIEELVQLINLVGKVKTIPEHLIELLPNQDHKLKLAKIGKLYLIITN